MDGLQENEEKTHALGGVALGASEDLLRAIATSVATAIVKVGIITIYAVKYSLVSRYCKMPQRATSCDHCDVAKTVYWMGCRLGDTFLLSKSRENRLINSNSILIHHAGLSKQKIKMFATVSAGSTWFLEDLFLA